MTVSKKKKQEKKGKKKKKESRDGIGCEDPFLFPR